MPIAFTASTHSWIWLKSRWLNGAASNGAISVFQPVDLSGASVRAASIAKYSSNELAALFLVMACEHAFEAAGDTGLAGRGSELYGMAEDLVVRRARELYAQGPAV